MLGLVILAGLLVVGLFVGAARLRAGLAMELLAPRRAAARSSRSSHHDSAVGDAQYTVGSRQAIDAPR